MTVHSVEALMTALTHQLVSDVIEADSVFIQLPMEFAQSLMTQTTTRMIVKKKRVPSRC